MFRRIGEGWLDFEKPSQNLESDKMSLRNVAKMCKDRADLTHMKYSISFFGFANTYFKSFDIKKGLISLPPTHPFISFWTRPLAMLSTNFVTLSKLLIMDIYGI